MVLVNGGNFCLSKDEWPNTREKNRDCIQLVDPDARCRISSMVLCNTCVEDPSQSVLMRREASKKSRTITNIGSGHSDMLGTGREGNSFTINFDRVCSFGK